MIMFYRKVARTFSQNAYRDQLREEVNRLIVDIERESDQAVTILEDKIRQIEKLINDTDRHLALVEKEHEKWNYQAQFMQEHQAAKEDAPYTAEQKKDTIVVYTKPLGVSETAVKVPSVLDPRKQVVELARQGFSIDFIAQKVDLPIGEIALILSIDK